MTGGGMEGMKSQPVAGLARVVERVGAAAVRAGRHLDDVTVVAVSKERSVDEIRALYDAGHRDFGENRADELAEKAVALPDDIRWHFVGHLQSNKARIVRPIATVLHSMDRASLAKAWLKGSGSPPSCFLQVNIGREPQKYGVDPDEAVEAADRLAERGVPLVGVMAIVPIARRPEDARPYFSALADLGGAVSDAVPGAIGLSMGMTDDFEVAVEAGATVIRVGRAIFDPDHASV